MSFLQINNQTIKLIKSLERKSVRESEKLFVVEGLKSVNELLNSDYECLGLYTTSDKRLNKDAIKISKKDMDRMSHLSSPSEYLALAKQKKTTSPNLELPSIILDEVNDPGNLGAIIRIADWFGMKQVICSPNSVDFYNSKVVMASMGSIFRMEICQTVLIPFIKQTELPTYAAVMNGNNLYQSKLDFPAHLVLGSEAHGLQKEIEKVCSEKITIPKFGHAESLNLSVSCGIIMSWFRA